MIKKLEIIPIVEKYINLIISDKEHRYLSWDYCFEAFQQDEPEKDLVLKLAYYLASWGMHRGSGGLLQKNHLVHTRAVQILNLPKHQKLKCNENRDVDKYSIPEIESLKADLAIHYSKVPYTRKLKSKTISPTETLLSKIMLGAFCCVPAYDTFFVKGLKEAGMKNRKFTMASLIELFTFVETNHEEIKQCQQLVKDKLNSHYPIMKIVDMYFWQIGFDKKIQEDKAAADEKKRKKSNNLRS